LITAESQTTVEEFFVRRRLGLMNEEHLTARQVEAFAILEKELAARRRPERIFRVAPLRSRLTD